MLIIFLWAEVPLVLQVVTNNPEGLVASIFTFRDFDNYLQGERCHSLEDHSRHLHRLEDLRRQNVARLLVLSFPSRHAV
jgi:hypothetical protein